MICPVLLKTVAEETHKNRIRSAKMARLAAMVRPQRDRKIKVKVLFFSVVILFIVLAYQPGFALAQEAVQRTMNKFEHNAQYLQKWSQQ